MKFLFWPVSTGASSAAAPQGGLTTIRIPDLLVAAAVELRVTRAGGTLEPGVAAWMLQKLNRMMDLWCVTPNAPYVKQFNSYVPTVNHAPHMIGPGAGADWATTLGRPDKILAANVVLNTVTPNVRIPIRIRDRRWWSQVNVQGLGNSIVSDLYYEDTWPNGTVNLWPVPTIAYPIELLTDVNFASFGPTDVVDMPFGFQDAMILSLAEACAPGLGQTPTDELKLQAMNARVIVFGGNDDRSKDVRTRDGGMPGGHSGRNWLYRTGRSK